MRRLYKEVTLYTGEKANISMNSVPIDPEKLKNILNNKGLMASQISRNIGYASNTLSSAINAGVVNRIFVTAMKNQYGIDPSEYELVWGVKQEEPQKEPQEEPKVDQAKENADLANIIYAAVHDAMCEVFNKKLSEMRNAMYTSLLCAMRKNREERMNQK